MNSVLLLVQLCYSFGSCYVDSCGVVIRLVLLYRVCYELGVVINSVVL